jgi:calnexin
VSAACGGPSPHLICFCGILEGTFDQLNSLKLTQFFFRTADEEKYSGKFESAKPLPDLDETALKVPAKARHYGVAASLPTPVDPSSQPLVLQYDVKLAEGITCGGAYLKFLTADPTFKPAALKDDTPYTVMFGPDKCGSTNKVHLILRHKSPKTGKIEEKHLKFPPSIKDDTKTHIYTAVLYPSNSSYAVLIDGEEKKAGSLFEDFEPPFVPSDSMPDPDDTKPEDWVEEAKIADPTASKPDDWDDNAPMTIPDEDAVKPEGWLDDEPAELDDPDAEAPEEWDEEEDGEWEAPRVPNPACKTAPGCGEWVRPQKPNPAFKGIWSAPLIDNPEYKGEWAPREIPNPDYYDDKEPLSHVGKVGAVAIEIWTMDEGYFFDNIVVTNSVDEAAGVRAVTLPKRRAIEDKEEEDKKAKAAAAAAEKKEEGAEGGATGVLAVLRARAATGIELVFDSKLLSPYAAKLEGVRVFFEDNPLAFIAAFVAPVALMLTPVALSFAGSQKEAVAVGEAKKKDASGPDDKVSPKGKKPNGKKQGE